MLDKSRSRVVRWMVAALLSAYALLALSAQDPGAANPDAERKAAYEAAAKATIRGPTQLPFADQAKLALPAGYHFIPAAEATRLIKSMGNTVDPGFQGLVVPDSNRHGFFAVSYHASGYIKDGDAKDWDADKLLDQIRQATAESNKRRAEIGVPEVEVTGWIQPPKYEATNHEVVWSLASRTKNAPANETVNGINYKTLVLGREGYMAMTLVTDQAHIEQMRPSTVTLLDALTFNDGKRYADFHAGTDRVAEFGLAALIAGVAAKKLGLLALIAAFVVKFAKVIIVAVAGVLVAARKWLGWKKKEPPAAAPVAATALAPPAAPPPASPTDTA